MRFQQFEISKREVKKGGMEILLSRVYPDGAVDRHERAGLVSNIELKEHDVAVFHDVFFAFHTV